MADGLLLSVRFLDGRYHGSGDWPPAPARLFQALVAGAARGQTLADDARATLAWLETLPAPIIAAPVARPGQPFTTFVPNNDLDTLGGDPRRVGEIRAAKAVRPILFDERAAIDYLWQFDPDPAAARQAAAACALADRLYQLGRGVDAAWAQGRLVDWTATDAALANDGRAVHRPAGTGEHGTLACPVPGSLASLEARFAAGRTRLRATGGNRRQQWLFIQPPKARFAMVAYDSPPRRLLFELRAGSGEDRFVPWPLTGTAALCERVRDLAAARLARALPAQSAMIDRLLVGRGAGAGDLPRRVRLLALPSIGHRHVDHAIRRLLVEIPADCPLAAGDVAWAFSGLALDLADPETGEVLGGGALLVAVDDPRPLAPYRIGVGTAAVWRSVTPLALPGVARRGRGGAARIAEEAQAIAAVTRALRHAGIGRTATAIRVQREPFGRRGRPATDFAADTRFGPDRLWHVEIGFDSPVAGPLVLGDGRFLGLGLMAPHDRPGHDAVALALPPDAAIDMADAPALLLAARRALMALARDDKGGVPRLFSGHEPDGSKARSGRHEHVFLAADGGRRIHRLIVAPPWTADRGVTARPDQRALFDRVAGALRQLRAGRLGRLDLGPALALAAADPLVTAARHWESRTPYHPPRQLRRGGDPATAIADALRAECTARGLPQPEVEVIEASAGPRGGNPVARLRLRFATAVTGPLMLGRDSHRGGGLFAAVPDGPADDG